MSHTIVCLSSYFKGADFMDEMRHLGKKVILITSESLREADWPWHAIDEVFYMPEVKPNQWNLGDLEKAFAHLLRSRKVDIITALDDYDIEKAAMLRETFRIPGMGQTTQRYFRDKLAMRRNAKDFGINVPEFTDVFNDERLNEFVDRVPGPWVLKPRSEAAAAGIKKVHNKEELWNHINKLGDERHLFLLEVFKPGKVYHVDSVIFNKEIKFAHASGYLAPPMAVAQQGGVFRTATLNPQSEEFIDLIELNEKVLKSSGIVHGASHTEFIKSDEDGQYYFLETSARVGGAYISYLVEAATGVNIWREWARLEDAYLSGNSYGVQPKKEVYAGLFISMINQESPELEAFKTTSFQRSFNKPYHIGLLYANKFEDKLHSELEAAVHTLNSLGF